MPLSGVGVADALDEGVTVVEIDVLVEKDVVADRIVVAETTVDVRVVD